MSTPEDPTKRITDIDTFTFYLVGYRTSIVESRPSQWINILGQPFTPPDNPRPTVSLYGISWQAIPSSLQKILTSQYPACRVVHDEKTVNLRLDIPEGRLSFHVNSPSIEHGVRAGSDSFDKVGNIIIPSDGLILFLRDGDPMPPKGHWLISHRTPTPAELRFVKRFLFKGPLTLLSEREENKIFRAINKVVKTPANPLKISSKPAVLQELHDIISLLEAGNERSTWGERLVT